MKFILKNTVKLSKINRSKNFMTISVKIAIYNKDVKKRKGGGYNLSKVRY